MKSIEKTIMRLISSGFDPDTRSDPRRSAYRVRHTRPDPARCTARAPGARGRRRWAAGLSSSSTSAVCGTLRGSPPLCRPLRPRAQ